MQTVKDIVHDVADHLPEQAILDDAMQALQQAFPGREVEVLETQDVDWSPQRMSAAARRATRDP